MLCHLHRRAKIHVYSRRHKIRFRLAAATHQRKTLPVLFSHTQHTAHRRSAQPALIHYYMSNIRSHVTIALPPDHYNGHLRHHRCIPPHPQESGGPYHPTPSLSCSDLLIQISTPLAAILALTELIENSDGMSSSTRPPSSAQAYLSHAKPALCSSLCRPSTTVPRL